MFPSPPHTSDQGIRIIEIHPPVPTATSFSQPTPPDILIRPQQDYVSDLQRANQQIQELTQQRDEARAQLTDTTRQLDALKASSYSKNEVDAQRNALLAQLDNLTAVKNREIQNLKNRILEITKTDSPFLAIEPKTNQPEEKQ
jgi:chromosome segregation ATPase